MCRTVIDIAVSDSQQERCMGAGPNGTKGRRRRGEEEGLGSPWNIFKIPALRSAHTGRAEGSLTRRSCSAAACVSCAQMSKLALFSEMLPARKDHGT